MGEGISGTSGDQENGAHDGTGSGGKRDSADSKWDQELQSLLEGDALETRFRELSAEEREKHARETRKRQKKARKDQRKAGRRRRLRRTAWGLAAVVVIGGGAFGYIRFGRSAGGSGGPNDTQTITNGAVPRTSATAASPLTASGPPANPFSGTPAAGWANGAAGITIPAAKPIGRYSQAQVEYAYQTTKKLLVAAALNEQTLNGGAPAAFARLLTQQQRTYFTGNLDKTGTGKQGSPLSSRTMVMSFAPGTTRLIGSAIRVHGRMSAHSATASHGQPVLEVDLNYRVVYAVEPPKAPADWMRVVGQFDGPVQFGEWAGADTPFGPWWVLGSGVAGARCDTKDGFVHPDYPNGPADATSGKGRVINPYSLGDMPGPGCNSTTGT